MELPQSKLHNINRRVDCQHSSFICVYIAGLHCCFVYAAYDQNLVEEQELDLLRQFDLNADYGPCSGITCSYVITYLSVQRNFGIMYLSNRCLHVFHAVK